MPNIIIAIDGFSSTGKSTFARMIASRLGIIYLDSGALYRAVTLYALENGLIGSDNTIDDAALVKSLEEDVDIYIDRVPGGDGCAVFLNGRNVEGRIRMLDVTGKVSFIAAAPYVRDFVDRILHSYGSLGCVMDGRDIGTAVFPDADLKIFMTADVQVRASRRQKEMNRSGIETDFEKVLDNVRERDYIDSHREKNPLRCASDAILLDNTDMTLEDQMVWLSGILKERFGITI